MHVRFAQLLRLGLVLLVSCRAPGSSTGSLPIPEAQADEPGARPPGAAVIELFTSEGCSSCPPADTLLAELLRANRAANRPLYGLEFHVDYWDELGWRDRFASADFTARQHLYARAFGEDGMYTPQMIVGGTEQFAGSSRERAYASVGRALTRPASVHLVLQVRANGPHALAIDYEARGAPADAVLDVAVVEHSTATDVRAGENAGKILSHANVVRAFVTAPLTGGARESGSTAIPMPAGLAPDAGEVIAYVQRAASAEGGGMSVLGAARAALP